MLRRPLPQKHVHHSTVRITQEALEGASVLPTADYRGGIRGFDISTMADTPYEAALALNTALVRLAMAFQREAEAIQREFLDAEQDTKGTKWFQVRNVWHGEDLPVRLCPPLMEGEEHKPHNWRFADEEAASYCPGELLP